MNEGKYVFTQVNGLVPRQVFQRLVKKYNGDYRVREFNYTNRRRQRVNPVESQREQRLPHIRGAMQPLIKNQDVNELTLF